MTPQYDIRRYDAEPERYYVQEPNPEYESCPYARLASDHPGWDPTDPTPPPPKRIDVEKERARYCELSIHSDQWTTDISIRAVGVSV